MKRLNKLLTIFAVVLVLLTSTPAFCEAEQENALTSQPVVEYQTRKPMRKRDLAMKFVMAMIGVVASSVTIFVLLSLYNKLMYGTVTAKQTEQFEDNDYKTSTNMRDALRIFLKKTK